MENVILEVGMKAPDFVLMGSDNKEHRLSDYLGKKVILYFYPKDNTPGCSKEAEAFRDNFEHFSKENAVILEEISMNPKKYLGYKIITDGFVCKENYLSNNQFILGKIVMNCCRADAEVFAIAAQYTDIKSLREKDRKSVV